ncbi:TerD family protein [Desmonostoc muscorum LEGE 12446]|uniref:TerD family protein n=1 Tax=Desmonostoc muscorum LEGE 12446 TaxID=1828758 RepID=A0A8J7DBQ6_DESMC|nr:TerD family protein [Desmonostoc muscorum]MCF2150633.1 TerD family protein [Desmonostoc muscorum LEGE 12446]
MEIELSKGGRFNLSQEAPNLKKVAIGLGWQVNQAGQTYDIDASVFMLGADGKIPDEKYFVFYNNLQSLDGSLKHSGDNRTGEGNGDDETIYVDLAKVNPAIQEIVFVVTIHQGQENNQNFSQIKNAFIKIYNHENRNSLARYNLREAFSQETALEFGRLYKKDEQWRFQAVGEGYSSGLQSFVDKYIVETKQEGKKEDEKEKYKNSEKIALDKKLEQEAPHIFNLAKKADISLQKVNLTNHQAKVVLCLDISGSMSSLYSSGKIQRLAEKILALGCRFDDNASIDIFLFGAKAHNVGEMTIENFKSFIQNLLQKYPLEGGTYYGQAINMIRKFYFPISKKSSQSNIVSLNKPVYVMFVTDGATSDESQTQQYLKESSYEPIFWQFMAIGKSRKDVKKKGILGWLSQVNTSDFSFLERLDEIGDRYLDNSDFFSLEDPENVADQELYDLLMTEYPNWVKLAKTKNLFQ